jgi:hypothetical protein
LPAKARPKGLLKPRRGPIKARLRLLGARPGPRHQPRTRAVRPAQSSPDATLSAAKPRRPSPRRRKPHRPARKSPSLRTRPDARAALFADGSCQAHEAEAEIWP